MVSRGLSSRLWSRRKNPVFGCSDVDGWEGDVAIVDVVTVVVVDTVVVVNIVVDVVVIDSGVVVKAVRQRTT